MNKYFVPLLVIAVVVSVPISIWGTRQWLVNFAYKVDVRFIDYVIVILAFFLFVSSAISIQSMRYAGQNPKDVLAED